jgi:hypothetical protein
MQHYTNTLYDTFGNAISGATVYVYAAGTTTPSTIYSDNISTSTTNPLTTGSDGSFDFYAANGRYDLAITHPSHTFTNADTLGIALFDQAAIPITSWTPSVGGSATYTSRAGSMVKIGPLVFIQGYMNINAIGTGSTSIITGLTYLATDDVPIVVTRSSGLASSVVSLSGFVNSGGLQIDLLGRTAAAAEESTVAVLGNSSFISFSGAYLTNS